MIKGAHDDFMCFDHPGADCHQTQARFDMRDHLCWHMSHDELFAIGDELEPKTKGTVEFVLLGLLDTLTSYRRRQREKLEYHAADLRIEKKVAKHAIAKVAVYNAMLHRISETTKKDRKKAA